MLQKHQNPIARPPGGQCVFGGRLGVETVHQRQSNSAFSCLPQNDFQKGAAVFDPDQRLGSGKSHAGAQAAVEHDVHGLFANLPARTNEILQLIECGHFVGHDRPDLTIAYHSGFAVHDLAVVMGEGLDCRTGLTGGGHFFPESRQLVPVC